jgi:hypothetical protein
MPSRIAAPRRTKEEDHKVLLFFYAIGIAVDNVVAGAVKQ